jgi:hypothetical protein
MIIRIYKEYFAAILFGLSEHDDQIRVGKCRRSVRKRRVGNQSR